MLRAMRARSGTHRARFAVLSVVLVVTACQPTPINPAVDDWVECADCGRDAYERVVAVGTPAVPVLSDWLLNGPPSDRVERVRASTMRILAGSPAMSSARQAAIVNKQLADYARQYRRRSALALGGIGGSDALAALCRARLTASSLLERTVLDSAVGRTGRVCS